MKVSRGYRFSALCQLDQPISRQFRHVDRDGHEIPFRKGAGYREQTAEWPSLRIRVRNPEVFRTISADSDGGKACMPEARDGMVEQRAPLPWQKRFVAAHTPAAAAGENDADAILSYVHGHGCRQL